MKQLAIIQGYCLQYKSTMWFQTDKKKKEKSYYLLGILTVEHPEHKYIDERDEERRVGVELLLFHEHICSVTKVKIAHDDAHPAERLE